MRGIAEMLREWRTFYSVVITHPLRTGAICPSGTRLAEIMTGGVLPDHSPVIELGAGTGAFTRHLIERGIPERELVLVEISVHFARLLKIKYPRACVIQIDATELGDVALPSAVKAGAVVSGLPLRSLPNDQVFEVLRSAMNHMRRDGVLYQFTYLPMKPVTDSVLDRLGLTIQFIGMAIRNIPPAFVYKVRRIGQETCCSPERRLTHRRGSSRLSHCPASCVPRHESWCRCTA
jgi:phospholipid N-methyltransferase